MSKKKKHQEALIGEMTFIDIARPMNPFMVMPEGSGWIFPKHGYKLIVTKDTKLKKSTIWNKHQRIPVLKVKH